MTDSRPVQSRDDFKAASRWEVMCVKWLYNGKPPELPEGWEPFAVLPAYGHGVSVYLRRHPDA